MTATNPSNEPACHAQLRAVAKQMGKKHRPNWWIRWAIRKGVK